MKTDVRAAELSTKNIVCQLENDTKSTQNHMVTSFEYQSHLRADSLDARPERRGGEKHL